jgi:GIY-YIG catalytic domain
MDSKKRELKRDYKETPRPMGVYKICNTTNNKILVGASVNLPGILNRHRFELQMGGHKNRALQADWNEFGGECFTFEVIEELKPKGETPAGLKEELATLEEIYLDMLQPYGERGYNEAKRDQAEKLSLIMNRRSSV